MPHGEKKLSLLRRHKNHDSSDLKSAVNSISSKAANSDQLCSANISADAQLGCVLLHKEVILTTS